MNSTPEPLEQECPIPRFTSIEQAVHLAALLLIALAIALIMTPAAYHRIAVRGTLSRRFIDLASRFLESALVPLMLGISLDLFLLGRLIFDNVALRIAIGIAMFSYSLASGSFSHGLQHPPDAHKENYSLMKNIDPDPPGRV